ncbi:MAG TPA: hypothetical protein VFC56_16160 [Stellaceae bacterium]|nr:hypothetical protein [Stellaceae bacterium]
MSVTVKNGALGYIGATINGLRAAFTVSLPGLIAAAHREGATATRAYLKNIASYGFASRGRDLTPRHRAIETRLRTFADKSYE